ncbi:GNAT family N-acetyltransferase [Sporomusa termitida]|uniref:Acetyltransferase (GNAT) family protein n=1 Tax=Sporomusa termitida TaxID=2377 RepID=A0A517DQ57_9FIRM|nr:GNAT family N-acetyltransferase [Sporomusa termitida]QDR79489.1 Acetyltransferase (GNAT) family protein [Sporomusa termitida]
MPNIIIRRFSPEYEDEVVKLILHIQQNEFNIPIGKEDQPDLSDIPHFYQSGCGNFWLASCGTEIVGTIALIDIGNQQGALRKMFVKTAYRGKMYNTATLLLGELLAWAQEKELREIYLGTTAKFLAAHRFYEKNRFVQIPRELLPSRFPVMKVDTRFYKFVV